jgi:DNA adenine methylase
MIYTPPKNQLLKWIGNKHRFSKQIVGFFPNKINCFFEPFLGSGSIIATLAPNKGIGSDIYSPLMEIWDTLSKDPKKLIFWYEERINLLKRNGQKESYTIIRDSFNKQPNGADFLFLTRTCYGGVIRFRKEDGKFSTPCGIHYPLSVEKFGERVFEWHSRLKNSSFLCSDYKNIFDMAHKNDFIYCDPPYFNSQKIVYGSHQFNFQNLINEIDSLKTRGVRVALSIDSHKSTLNIEIPSSLFPTQIDIVCGPPLLTRLQKKSNQVKVIIDKLWLTY